MRELLKIFLIMLFFSQNMNAQPNVYCSAEALKLKGMIEKYHVSPPSFDTTFSALVFNKYVTKLDPYKIYFSKEDIEELKKYRYLLISGMNDINWNFIEQSKEKFIDGLNRYKDVSSRILNNSLDLNKQEFLIANHYFGSIKNDDYNNLVRKVIKYKVLNQMFLKDDSLIEQTNYHALGQKAIKKVLKLETGRISKRLKQSKEMDQFLTSSFLNALAETADPHTEYFSKSEKELFESNLESKKLSFGLRFEVNENDELVISGLVPGGPAWKSNAFHKGDVIVGYKISGMQKVDVDSVDIEETNSKLVSPENKLIEFYYRKSDGTLKSCELKKGLLDEEDNMVRSCILRGDITVGYIALPAFYSEFENHSNLGCANDVAKVCIQLQKEKIGGIILDLRDNGGGSVKEAIDLAGLFIDYGPICITRERNQKPAVIKDFNRGSAYTGPLVVLVNRQSASASEIFAATMQDYARAVVIGDRTFGKATAQVILPCDTNLNHQNDSRGFVKLTTGKVYRITGKSNQLKGLEPDMKLPDILGNMLDGEMDEKQALTNDSVKRSLFSPSVNFSLDDLKTKSNFRISHDTSFQLLQNLGDSVKVFIRGNKEIPLDILGFSNYLLRKKKIINKLEGVYERENSTYKTGVVNQNSSLKSVQSEEDISFVQKSQKDIYVNEAYQIIVDIVNQKINKTSK